MRKILEPTLPRVQFDPKEIGFTLLSDDETLREVEQIAVEAFLAREFPPRILLR